MTTKASNIEIKKPSSRGASNQRVARAGEHFVAAELDKRGVYAVTFAGNMPRIDLLACNSDQRRTVQIQVKTKGAVGRGKQVLLIVWRWMSREIRWT